MKEMKNEMKSLDSRTCLTEIESVIMDKLYKNYNQRRKKRR
jgi:hypothetical protein